MRRADWCGVGTAVAEGIHLQANWFPLCPGLMAVSKTISLICFLCNSWHWDRGVAGTYAGPSHSLSCRPLAGQLVGSF